MLLLFLILISIGSSERRIVTVELNGGLGNRIFQLLAGLGYAERHNRRFVLVRSFVTKGEQEHEHDSLEPLLALFPTVEVQSTLEDYDHLETKGGAFRYEDLPDSTRNVVLHGYFQSERYFPSRAPSLQVPSYPHTYFIHIRAGDYLSSKTHFIDLTSYHRRALHAIRQEDRAAKFLVFSNDNEYAHTYMNQFQIPYTLSATTKAEDTLRDMAACVGGICANSSLSWLGAYFQAPPRSHVYMPDRWINDGQDTRDLYPSWATVLPTA